MDSIQSNRKQNGVLVTPPYTPGKQQDSVLEDATKSYVDIGNSSDQDNKEHAPGKRVASSPPERPPRNPHRRSPPPYDYVSKAIQTSLVDLLAFKWRVKCNAYIRATRKTITSLLETVRVLVLDLKANIVKLYDILHDSSHKLIPFIPVLTLYSLWAMHYVCLFVGMAIKLFIMLTVDSFAVHFAQLAHYVHELDKKIASPSALKLDLFTQFGMTDAANLSAAHSMTRQIVKTQRLSPVDDMRTSSFSDLEAKLPPPSPNDEVELELRTPESLRQPLGDSPAPVAASLLVIEADSTSRFSTDEDETELCTPESLRQPLGDSPAPVEAPLPPSPTPQPRPRGPPSSRFPINEDEIELHSSKSLHQPLCDSPALIVGSVVRAAPLPPPTSRFSVDDENELRTPESAPHRTLCDLPAPTPALLPPAAPPARPPSPPQQVREAVAAVAALPLSPPLDPRLPPGLALQQLLKQHPLADRAQAPAQPLPDANANKIVLRGARPAAAVKEVDENVVHGPTEVAGDAKQAHASAFKMVRHLAHAPRKRVPFGNVANAPVPQATPAAADAMNLVPRQAAPTLLEPHAIRSRARRVAQAQAVPVLPAAGAVAGPGSRRAQGDTVLEPHAIKSRARHAAPAQAVPVPQPTGAVADPNSQRAQGETVLELHAIKSRARRAAQAQAVQAAVAHEEVESDKQREQGATWLEPHAIKSRARREARARAAEASPYVALAQQDVVARRAVADPSPVLARKLRLVDHPSVAYPAAPPGLPAPAHKRKGTLIARYPPRELHTGDILCDPSSQQQWRILGGIGRGGFGSVYCAESLPGGGPDVAIKQLPKAAAMRRDGSLRDVHREITVLTMATMSNSPLLQKMICSFEDATSVYIVMHLHGCSLSARMDLAKRCAPIDDVDRAIYMAEMVQAVEDLHALNVIHRDIKPDNFVLTATGNVVLTDFGVAHVFGHSVRELWKAPLWAGTAGYLAPEMDSGKPDGEQRGHGAPADVWSLGMVFIELACGFDQGFFADVRARNGERPLAADEAWAAPPSIDTIRGALAMLPDRLLRDLLLGMLKMDPAERLDIAAIKRHPYFAQIDWETVMAHGYKTDFTPTLEITSLPPPQQHLAQSRIRGATGEPLTCPCFSPMSIVLRPDVPRERVAIDYVIR